jgi:hypothetical protein
MARQAHWILLGLLPLAFAGAIGRPGAGMGERLLLSPAAGASAAGTIEGGGMKALPPRAGARAPPRGRTGMI